MIKISILLPTRGRPFLLQRLFESIAKTTSDLTGIEVVLYMDDDDVASHEITHQGLKIIKIIRPCGKSMGNIFRECYGASKGQYSMLMNDDAVFRTEGWDLAVIGAFANFPDDIALVYGNDLDQGKHVPTFPILSRKVCEIMGGISPIGYLNLHIESHIFDIFKQLKTMGHNRIIYLEDVIFEHMHYVVGKSDHDKTYKKKNLMADHLLFIESDEERSFIARRLAFYIEKGYIQTGLSEKNNYGEVVSYGSPEPAVSIVVPVFYKDINTSANCFEAIINEMSGEIPSEVIIVVNFGLTDILPSYLLNQRGEIKIIQCKEKHTLPRLYNSGARVARGDYLIFISNNIVPKPGWLYAMVKMAKTDDNIVVVGCKHLNPRNGRIHHAGISFFNDGGKFKVTYIYRGKNADDPVVNILREFQAVSGACMIVNKKIFFEIGGFDETLNFMEDIDLCLKIREKGMKILYTPEAVVYHYPNERGYSECEGTFGTSSLLFSKWEGKVEYDLERILKEDNFLLCKKEDAYYTTKLS